MAIIGAQTESARLCILPASAAPVLLGTGTASDLGRGNVWLAVGCLMMASAIQIGVNFANDYSDGIRGTDEYRPRPPRLVGGDKNLRRILAVALGLFALAVGVGLAMVIASASWWLVVVGAVALVAT